MLHTDRSLLAGGSCLAHALRLTPGRRRLDGLPVRPHSRPRRHRDAARTRRPRRAVRALRACRTRWRSTAGTG
ncbi:hypothetical protein LT493_27230 [Streptomyces tricolor]|nr:hypothetical protein [Streptomyces tricolor]